MNALTVKYTTPDFLATIAPKHAEIELDHPAGHYVLVIGGTEWRAPFEEPCS